MAGHRLLSHTEIETAQTCWARHAFAYTGHLTQGHTLRPRSIPRVLSEGRAWGAAAAKWHAGTRTLLAGVEAADALRASLDLDELEMFERGYNMAAEERVQIEAHLLAVFAHYVSTTTQLHNLERLEHEFDVAIPSRNRRTDRSSTRYRFQGYLDGIETDPDGNRWLVEFKLRGQLTPVEVLQNSRQIRWYAWALREAKGIEPIGVLVDERLNVAPAEPRVVRAQRKGEGIDGFTVSHATNQTCTPDSYRAACLHYGVEPSLGTLEALQSRAWQQRVPIVFRPSELDEAGYELTSAAKLIRDLDSGELYPMRHARASICNSCRFRRICANPDDALFVETLFEPATPKRFKEEP